MIVLIIFHLRIWGKAHFFLSNGSWEVEERSSRKELLWTKNIPLFDGSAEIWSKDKWAEGRSLIYEAGRDKVSFWLRHLAYRCQSRWYLWNHMVLREAVWCWKSTRQAWVWALASVGYVTSNLTGPEFLHLSGRNHRFLWRFHEVNEVPKHGTWLLYAGANNPLFHSPYPIPHFQRLERDAAGLDS